MIKSIKVTNYLDESITISLRRPLETGFLIKKIDGLGPTKANINTSEISTNDGAMFNSSRINQRNITISMLFVESEIGESIEDIRQKSYKYFPIKKELKLIIETDNRTVEISGYVESNEPDIFNSRESTQISIMCPDPFFYSTGEEGTGTTVFYGVQQSFEFPFENASLNGAVIEFGVIQNKSENVITYNGDSEIGITIIIHAIGDASDITIYNTGTREIMFIDTTKLSALTGAGVGNGDEITITTSKGNKRCTLLRNGIRTNILNCLGRSSSWFSLAKGDNIFAFSAVSGSTNLQFRIQNKVVFEGV